MGEDFFRYLPSEMTLNILSRLDARTAVRGKCVCKPWLDLLSTPEFVKSHLSKSVPGFAILKSVSTTHSKPFMFAEFGDEVDLKCDQHRLNIVFNLELPFREPMHSSANGLIFLVDFRIRGDLILCNPVTREYITLPCPRQPFSETLWEVYGFGVSKMSGQYKVVRIFVETRPQAPHRVNHVCQVYTVGTGSWRRICNDKIWRVFSNTTVEFLSGNLHWLSRNDRGPKCISCLDLETELFSTFSAPPCVDYRIKGDLSILRGCLCVCAKSFHMQIHASYEIDIWVMKEYRDEKSWTKEFTVRNLNIDDYLGTLVAIKVFENGDILMNYAMVNPIYYSSKTRTIQEIDQFGSEGYHIRLYTPSFLPLKSFAMENVSSF